MPLNIPMALGSNRVARTIRDELAVSLLRTAFGKAPDVIGRLGFLHIFQIADCLFGGHPVCGGSFWRWRTERLHVVASAYKHDALPGLRNAVVSRLIQFVLDLVSKLAEVR